MEPRRRTPTLLARTLLACGAVGTSLALVLLATSAAADPAAPGTQQARWVHYITPDGRFHLTRDPATVPPEAATLQPAVARQSRDLCTTVGRMDARGLGYWARHGLLRIEASEPVRACLDRSAPVLARAMAAHCEAHGSGGYQAWSDLVSIALRECER